jgi:putative ATP-dependent endonuclease of the OLD family
MSIRIDRVLIRNFRSIGHPGVEFIPGNLCALIGENNAGKSNIVAAIRKLLGPTWPQIQSFTEDDFHRRDRRNEPYIELDLTDGRTTDVMTFGQAPGDDQYRLLLNGRYVTREQRERYPFLTVGVDRGIKDNMGYDRWTPLGRMLQGINREFQRDARRRGAFEERMAEVKGILSESEDFARLEELVREQTALLLRRNPAEFRVDFNLYDPWNFYRTFQMIASDDNLEFQASSAGMGLQSALTVPVLRAYAEIRHTDAILAIEEPEIYLHPQAQRNFYGVLRELAEADTQVFYTTHSPNFLETSHFDEIALVRRDGSLGQRQTSVTQVTAAAFAGDFNARHEETLASEDSVRRHTAKHCSIRHHEGFFATKVILVEGETEEEALPIFARALDVDLDAHGISVLGCRGKTAMPEIYRLFNEFGIPTYAVFDGDHGKSDAHEETNRELLRLAGAEIEDFPATGVERCHTCFEVDFETELGNYIEDYADLVARANDELGLHPDRGKGMRAKWIAEQLVLRCSEDPSGLLPGFITAIFDVVQDLRWRATVLQQ